MSSVGHQTLLILQTSSHRIDNRRQSSSNKRRASLKVHKGKKKEGKKQKRMWKMQSTKATRNATSSVQIPRQAAKKEDIKYKKWCSKITRAKRRMGRINCSRDATKAPRLVPEEPRAGNDEISIATRLASRWGGNKINVNASPSVSREARSRSIPPAPRATCQSQFVRRGARVPSLP